MILLTPSPKGALFARGTPLLLASSPRRFPNPSPFAFSHPEPKFGCRNPRKGLSLTIANADGEGPSPSFPTEEPVFVAQDEVPLEGVIQFEKPNSSSKFKRWAHAALVAGGDVLFLLLFAAVGRFSHGFPVLSVETFQTADPFLAGWFLSAYFLGGYGEDGRGTNGLSKGVIAATKSWAVGIPLGVVIRAARSGHVPALSFVLVTMGSTGVLLIGWRTLLCTLYTKDQSKKNDVYRSGSPFELFELLTSLVRRW